MRKHHSGNTPICALMPLWQKIIIILWVATFMVPAKLLARDSTEVKSFPMNKIPISLVVAKVGDIKITAEEFLNGYEFGPAFVKRAPDSKRKYLDFLIYEKLLALEGYSKKLDTSEDVTQFLDEIKNDLATEQLYRDLIWDKIKVSQAEIEKAISKDNIELELKWIYKPTKEEIKDQYSALGKGVHFDSLFYGQFNDSISYDDRYLKTTRFKLDKFNPLLASIIDSIKIGEPSPPIKTEDGWYIVYISNLWKNVITTETDNENQYYSMQKYLTKEKADSASDVYVNSILQEQKPVIVRLTFYVLKSYLSKKYLSPEKFSLWNTIKNITPFIPRFNPERINDYEHLTLIKTKDDSLQIKHFLRWYTNREPYVKYDFRTHQNLSTSLQNIIWRMLRDNLLAEMAKQKSYHKHPEVTRQMEWWKDKIVYSKMKLEFSQVIKINEQEAKEFYELHKTDYKDRKGNLASYDEVKQDVWNDCYVYEYTRKIVSNVLTLKNKYKIKIDEKILEQLPVTNEHNPRAIETYTIKKGGTFVRPVYPTIDYEWQFWN